MEKKVQELNKEEINKKADLDKKLNMFYQEINYINNSLDILRNRFFNLIITRMYIKDINFNYEDYLNNITNAIVEIDKNYIDIVNNFNISYGDKSNEIENFVKDNYIKNMDKENDKKRIKKTNQEKKLKEENLLCSELKTTQEITKTNLID